jgi:hypothetical protein
MPNRTSQTGSELFIVDNSDTDRKVLRYLHEGCQIASGIDLASGTRATARCVAGFGVREGGSGSPDSATASCVTARGGMLGRPLPCGADNAALVACPPNETFVETSP